MRNHIDIIAEALSAAKGRALFKKFGGKVYAFKDLPEAGQKALLAYWTEEHGVRIPPTKKFGYVDLPIAALKDAIGGGDDEDDDFDAYHRWYVGQGGMPDHKEVWAVYLSRDEDEVLFDGWHRFHDYVRKGIAVIPAVIDLR